MEDCRTLIDTKRSLVIRFLITYLTVIDMSIATFLIGQMSDKREQE